MCVEVTCFSHEFNQYHHALSTRQFYTKSRHKLVKLLFNLKETGKIGCPVAGTNSAKYINDTKVSIHMCS